MGVAEVVVLADFVDLLVVERRARGEVEEEVLVAIEDLRSRPFTSFLKTLLLFLSK